MTLKDEIVKTLRTHGTLTEYEISERMFSEDMAYRVIDGERRMIPPKYVKMVCEDSCMVNTDGSTNALKTEHR